MTTKSNYTTQEEYTVKIPDEEIDEKEADTKYISTLFEDMDTEQLLTTFSDLIKQHPKPDKHIQTQVQELRRVFENKSQQSKKEKLEEFLSNGGNEEDFLYNIPSINQFKTLYQTYSEQLKTYREETEKKQKKNLETRLEIIEELKKLYLSPQAEDKPADILNRFRTLKRTWYDIGKVPHSKSNEIHKTYHHHLENFYHYLKLNKALQEAEYKHNLEQRNAIISRAEALLTDTNIQKALNELQYLHRLWKEDAVPVAEEHREPTWQKFKELSNKIYARKSELITRIEQEQQENLHKKRTLIKEIQALIPEKTDQSTQWRDLTHQITQLQQNFLLTGKVPPEENQNIWKTFKKTIKTFHHQKRQFFKLQEKNQQKSLEDKMKLIAEAERLQNSTDWNETARIFKKIQAEWKKSGPVPPKHSEEIWNRFQTACNHFFERYKTYRNREEEESDKNHDKKLEFLTEIKKNRLPSDEQEIIQSILQLHERWESFGKTPYNKPNLNTDFLQIIDQLIETLPLDEEKRKEIHYQIQKTRLIEGKDYEKIEDEIRRIRRQISDSERKLMQFENNMQLFSNTDQNNPLIKGVQEKLLQERQTLETWKKKYQDLVNIRSRTLKEDRQADPSQETEK